MYAVIANGFQTICKTQRRLENIIAIYPYPKFAKFASEDEAREWLRKNSRSITSSGRNQYGTTSSMGYVSVQYFIRDSGIYYNLDTSKVGYIRIAENEGIKVDSRRSLIKLKIWKKYLIDSIPRGIWLQ